MTTWFAGERGDDPRVQAFVDAVADAAGRWGFDDPASAVVQWLVSDPDGVLDSWGTVRHWRLKRRPPTRDVVERARRS